MMKKSRFRAFTLIELLVVISIIALLISILMPALTQAREQARRSVCSSDLKTFSLALKMYADENNDSLPLENPNIKGSWLWDLSFRTTDYLIAHGADKRNFYCPSNNTKASDMAHWWQYSIGGQPEDPIVDESTLNIDRAVESRVTSYFWIMDMEGPNRSGWDNARGYNLLNAEWIEKTTCRQPAEKELVTDATLSTSNAPDSEFLRVTGSCYQKWGAYDRSNHLTRQDRPAGGNILFVDGHVVWRPFEAMHVQTTWYPYHWW